MQKVAHEIYSFDEYKLDLTRGSLFRGVEELKLRPQSFEVLKYLTQNQGRLVSKDEIINAVWQGMAVTDDSLVQCLKDIRHVLGDQGQTIIRTVPRRGYIFEKTVAEIGSAVYFEETTGVRVLIEEPHEADSSGIAANEQPQMVVGRRSLIGGVKRYKLVAALAVMSIVLVGAGLGYVLFLRPPVSPFTSIGMKRLTTDGKAQAAAISPDGKYFAYAIGDAVRQSLVVRQVAALNSIQIVEPKDVEYTGLTFSPDSNFLYYVQGNVLYQTGTLGGSTRKLWDKVSSRVTFSPDGKRLAFVRFATGEGIGSRLIVANADGTGEPSILASRKPPEAFAAGGCSWSPDGKTIVCAGGDNPLFGQQYPIAVNVADGMQWPLTTMQWNLVSESAWLADGSGLVMTAFGNLDSDGQLWHVSFPGGIPTRIYSDLNGYFDVSLSSNSETLLTIQRQPQLNILAISLTEEPRQTRQLTFGTNGSDGRGCLTTTPDGRIVYSSESGPGGMWDLWIMDADGGNQKQLTFDESKETHADVSPDGRAIAFGVASQGIWKIDIDGGNRRQLTKYGMFPAYSGDSHWIYYTLPRDKFTLWKVSWQGGTPIRVTDYPAVQPAVSPDGKLIAYMYFKARNESKLYVAPIDGGEPFKIFDASALSFFDIDWSPDGTGIVYEASENGAQKMVSQALEGGVPRVLIATKGNSESRHAATFSPDGKQLFVSQGPIDQNVVMFNLSR